MSDLIAFLRARLDEDERVAEAVLTACRDSSKPWPPEQAPGQGGPVLTDYLRHFDEGRMLRDVKAKRAILVEHCPEPMSKYGRPVLRCAVCLRGRAGWQEDWAADQWPCSTVRHLLTEWDDHPDYRPEWKP